MVVILSHMFSDNEPCDRVVVISKTDERVSILLLD